MRGHAIQTWRFSEQSLIRIGRSNDNDVTIGDPQVSRHHVELHLRESGWELVSQGRHGTLIADELIDEGPLQHGTLLQLGPSGPKLRFCRSGAMGENETTVVRSGPAISEMLRLDQQETEEQVHEIVETPSFPAGSGACPQTPPGRFAARGSHRGILECFIPRWRRSFGRKPQIVNLSHRAVVVRFRWKTK